MAVRDTIHHLGGLLLEKLLGVDGGGYQGARIDCGQGHEAQFEGYRDKQLVTVLGAVGVRRAYYHCPDCGGGVVPKDVDLDLVSTSFSPGVRRMMGRVGAKEPFEEGQRDLEELAGVAVSTKAVERVSESIGSEIETVWERECERAFSDKILPFASSPAPTMYVAVDATAVPVLPSEVAGRQGKEGGEAKTREAKLGGVFSQTRRDEQGFPLRDPESTTYVGAIEEAAAFGARIYTEAARRGATRAPRLVVLGDGAPWIWGIAAEHFHQAIQIVDLYHARQRLSDLSKTVLGLDSPETQQWVRLHQELLDQGDIEALLDAMRQLPAEDKTARKARRTSIEYFRKNAERMRYACFIPTPGQVSLGTDLPSLPLEFGADLPPAFGGPFQRPHRIAPRRRIDDRLDRFHQPRLPLHGRLVSPARSPLPAPRQHALTRLSWTFPLQFAPPLDYRLLTHRQRLGHGSNPALSKTDRLAAGPQPSPPFI